MQIKIAIEKITAHILKKAKLLLILLEKIIVRKIKPTIPIIKENTPAIAPNLIGEIIPNQRFSLLL